MVKECNLCLVSFREACINFINLCKKKNEDRLWVDEIAAMQACSQQELPYLGTSGIILAGEDLETSQNLMINVHPNGLSNGKQNGSMDASDSTASHGSLDNSQGMVEYPIPHYSWKKTSNLWKNAVKKFLTSEYFITLKSNKEKKNSNNTWNMG